MHPSRSMLICRNYLRNRSRNPGLNHGDRENTGLQGLELMAIQAPNFKFSLKVNTVIEY